jgi:hypothetical protein
MKVYVLFFENNDICELRKVELREGMLDLGDKAFDVNNFRPKMLKKGFGSYVPLYLVRWDSINPPEEINPIFSPNDEMNPELLKKTVSFKILGNLITLRKSAISPIILLLIGLAFGGFLAYILLRAFIH